MSMDKHSHYLGSNITPMPTKHHDGLTPARELTGTAAACGGSAAAGGSEDPRMKEALRLIEAFLAIEDPTARAALVTLADRMVSYDWLRQVQKR